MPYPRLEDAARAFGPVARSLRQPLVLGEALGVYPALHLGERARLGAEEQLQQAGVA
jgi:hypothetical protein